MAKKPNNTQRPNSPSPNAQRHGAQRPGAVPSMPTSAAAAGTRTRRIGLIVAVVLGLVLMVAGLGSCFAGEDGASKGADGQQNDSAVQEAAPAAAEQTTTIKVPPLFFALEDAQSFADWAKARGAVDATVDADGGVTVTIADASLQEFGAALKQRATDTMDSIAKSSAFPNIERVTHSDDLRTITITMDKEAAGAGTTIASSAVALPVCLYQQMANLEVGAEVTVVDADGAVLVQESYPQAAADHAADLVGSAADSARGALDSFFSWASSGESGK